MARIPLPKAKIDQTLFNPAAVLPYNLRLQDFEMAMRDVYDFLHDTNQFLVDKSLPRLDDTVRSGLDVNEEKISSSTLSRRGERNTPRPAGCQQWMTIILKS